MLWKHFKGQNILNSGAVWLRDSLSRYAACCAVVLCNDFRYSTFVIIIFIRNIACCSIGDKLIIYYVDQPNSVHDGYEITSVDSSNKLVQHASPRISSMYIVIVQSLYSLGLLVVFFWHNKSVISQDNRPKFVICSINRKDGQLNQLEAFRKLGTLVKGNSDNHKRKR